MKTGRPRSKDPLKTVTLRMSYTTDQYLELLRKGAVRAAGVMSERTYSRSDMLEQAIDNFFMKKQYENNHPEQCGACYGTGMSSGEYQRQKQLNSKTK